MSKSQSMRWRNLQGNYQYERLQERGSRGKCVYLFYTGIDNTYWIGKSYNPEDTLNTLRKYKPDEFYEMIEKLSPTKYKMDIFSREKRGGWEQYGNETTKY